MRHFFTRLSSLSLPLLLLCACAAQKDSAASAPADLILVGKIYTGEADATVEAIAIDDGRIVYAGNHAGAHPYHGRDTQEIELGSAIAYPGFVDGHAHLRGIGLREMILNLEGTSSIEDLKARLSEELAGKEAGAVVYGRGWIETGWPENRFPTRDDLDAVSPNNPVLLERADGHALLLNSLAMAAAGIDESTEDMPGGRIERDKTGRATGLLIDNAALLAQDLIGTMTPERLREALRRGGDIYAHYGWTGVHNMSVEWADVVEMQTLSDEGMLALRVYNAVVPEALETLIEEGPQHSRNERIITRGLKLYADGALGSRGAALTFPYSDDLENRGLLLMTGSEAKQWMQKALDNDIQVATHAIGDRANRLVLDWYTDILDGAVSPRWRIEHSQIIDPNDIPRFGAHHIIASMQPSHAIGDLHFAPRRLGDTRLRGAYAWKSLTQSGALVVGGSDAPVERGDPMIEFYAAVARRDLKGFQGDNWHPEEVLSREQALALFTKNAAYASFQEGDLGTLAVGMKADISVFSADIMQIPEADIPATKAVMTLVDGDIIYDGRAE